MPDACPVPNPIPSIPLSTSHVFALPLSFFHPIILFHHSPSRSFHYLPRSFQVLPFLQSMHRKPQSLKGSRHSFLQNAINAITLFLLFASRSMVHTFPTSIVHPHIPVPSSVEVVQYTQVSTISSPLYSPCSYKSSPIPLLCANIH